MSLKNLRIQIIDDHQLFLQGLELLLRDSSALVLTSSDAEAALNELAVTTPDLILIDLSMPGMNGLAFIQAINARKLLIPVAVLSSTDDLYRIRQVLEAGAFGFIPKSYTSEGLLCAIDCIMKGEVYLPAEMKTKLAFLQAGHKDEVGSFGLSERQIQLLQLLAKGHPNKRISTILNISDETVKTHLRNIFKLLDVSSRTEAVAKALDLNIVTL